MAVDSGRPAIAAPATLGSLPFTPARVDPALARQVAKILGEDGLRFTPATKVLGGKERTVTVAVRVDAASARAISVRNTIASASAEQGRERALEIAPTSYNLGVARGYQSFAQPTKQVEVPAGLRDIAMPDLAEFRPEEKRTGKPSRFQSRIALANESATGRAPRTYESAGEQSVDLRGSYRLGRNLDVTAGVRVSQDRNRLAPLTDGVEDDQAVYVGTQIRF
ncbi:hypothetical protein IRL76_13515 [Qipengyuania soli]|uniref:Uncharacterized protein n=2 Tax=Qipengyuania soli TaxID=2782568 RepID=A0A7S8ITN8_9SPHN|nr:hypothetical protein IRL76_13515 [Qipengyuania soli]